MDFFLGSSLEAGIDSLGRQTADSKTRGSIPRQGKSSSRATEFCFKTGPGAGRSAKHVRSNIQEVRVTRKMCGCESNLIPATLHLRGRWAHPGFEGYGKLK